MENEDLARQIVQESRLWRMLLRLIISADEPPRNEAEMLEVALGSTPVPRDMESMFHEHNVRFVSHVLAALEADDAKRATDGA